MTNPDTSIKHVYCLLIPNIKTKRVLGLLKIILTEKKFTNFKKLVIKFTFNSNI